MQPGRIKQNLPFYLVDDNPKNLLAFTGSTIYKYIFPTAFPTAPYRGRDLAIGIMPVVSHTTRLIYKDNAHADRQQPDVPKNTDSLV